MHARISYTNMVHFELNVTNEINWWSFANGFAKTAKTNVTRTAEFPILVYLHSRLMMLHCFTDELKMRKNGIAKRF